MIILCSQDGKNEKKKGKKKKKGQILGFERSVLVKGEIEIMYNLMGKENSSSCLSETRL